ncbi:unnamed protein product, partial [Arabidopsis halleri]
MMRKYLDQPSLMKKGGILRKEFEVALAEGQPEAHYLEGLRIACWEADIKAAREHIFKALNHVEESTFLMAVLSICSGEEEVANLYASKLYKKDWGSVLAMG